MKKHILITGRPRVGKTTLLKHCAQLLGKNAGGFYTEEILGEGIRGRRGFQLITLSGESHCFAEVDAKSHYHVGRYGIFVEVLDQVAVPTILEAIQSLDQTWVLIDEIGRMEEGSEKFKEAVLTALDSSKKVLATISLHDSSFTEKIKHRNDVTLYKMTIPNRESLTHSLEDFLTRDCKIIRGQAS